MEIILVTLLVAVVTVFSYARGFANGQKRGLAVGRVTQAAMHDAEWAMKEAHNSIEKEFGDELEESAYIEEFQRRLEENLEIRYEEFVKGLRAEAGKDNEPD